MPMSRFVEIRAYNLECGTRDEFHQLMLTQSLPLLRKWQVDVVACGPSPHDSDSYYLLRAYDSLAHRTRSQDAFYASDEWKFGPREAVLAPIDNYTSVVIEMDAATIAALRTIP
ncbi:hypothetical protein RCH09_000026 [Actimicrobium sp. GrIS 1.19]|nr:hypothetical protein [Actimicrobium sp. GrIS 1.19]